jgi:phosphotransferase system enzyme I (PtsP)
MSQQQVTWGRSRRLLRRLRDIMAGPGTAQERLDQVTALIASDMVAEVCSIYIRRAGNVLELFATEGLRQDAVHKTRLMVGEGLVGDIAARAQAVALADAQKSPLFAYRPETGEEVYSSLMGVPILRGGRVLGVLVVQNRSQRSYADEEVEDLETIAMVLAEVISGGELINPDEARIDNAVGRPQRLEGAAYSPGLARGVAVVHRPRVTIDTMLSDDPAEEARRLDAAIVALQDEIDALLRRPDIGAAGEHRDIIETYRMFARDRGWHDRLVEAVQSGLSAEAAVQRVQDETRRRMAQASDAYLRERLLDLEDLTNRLLQQLTGGDDRGAAQLPDDTVLVARALGPAELLNFPEGKLRAVMLAEGSATAHVTIVARALDIPLVGRLSDILGQVETGDPVLVDGDNGAVVLRPGEEVQANFDAAIAARHRRLQAYAGLRDRPSVTRDGERVALLLNAGLLVDMDRLADSRAEGVGLYRTEIPFMIRATYPDVEMQTEFYRRVYDAAGDRPVCFRTLDIGGDKLLPYFRSFDEENPAMGWRALRISLDRPAMLRQQLRALVAASDGRPLHVMFPMVAQVAEFVAARELLDAELKRAARLGMTMPDGVSVGTMLEVPALALQLPALLPRVDFLSIGSNDLVQFLYASDRSNPRLEGRYDALSAPVLGLLGDIAAQCRAAGVPLTVCGEMAGDPLAALALLGLGVRRLSMAPGNIDAVRAMVLDANAAEVARYLAALRDSPAPSLRSRLRAFARDHGIAV